MNLLLGLQSIKKKDSSPLRRQLFSAYLEKNIFNTFIKNILLRNKKPGYIAANLFACYSIFEILKLNIDVKKIIRGNYAVYEYENEIRLIKARFNNLSSERICFEWSLKAWINGLGALKVILQNSKNFFKIYKLAINLILKNGVLVGARQSQFMMTYSYCSWIFAKFDFTGVNFISSTESNPNVIGVLLAAKNNHAKAIYVNHGFLDRSLGIFFHDRIIVQGGALKERIIPYLSKRTSESLIEVVGPYFSRIQMKHVNCNVSTVGVVLPLLPDEKKVLRLIKNINCKWSNAIIEVRLHPNKVFSKKVRKLLLNCRNVYIVKSADWKDIDLKWDFAFSGHSSAQVDLVGKGIPVVGYDLDNHPEDMYSFYENGFVIKVNNIDNLTERVNNFYQNKDWEKLCELYLPSLS